MIFRWTKEAERLFGTKQELSQKVYYQNLFSPYYIDEERWGGNAYDQNCIRRIVQFEAGLPQKINIETTTQCMLKCDFCVIHSGALDARRSKRFLDYEDFSRIIDSIQFFTTHIEFTGGEPLLNRSLGRMIALCNQKRIKTTLATNAQLLNRRRRQGLLDDAPTTLLIAYEAGHTDSYSKHRIGGTFKRFEKNLLAIIAERRERGTQYPRIQLQTVVSKKTLPYLDHFWEVAGDLGVDSACIKPVFIWPDGDRKYFETMINEYILSGHPLSYHHLDTGGRLEETGIANVCPNIYTTHIGTGGEVVPCWYNLLSSPSMGNVLQKAFVEIWFSEDYMRFREKMTQHTAYTHGCKFCIGIYKPELFKNRSYKKN